MSNTGKKKPNQVANIWFESKQSKTVRVSNQRETFQLKKLTRTLDSMKSMNDSLLKQEEKKIRKALVKLNEVPPYSPLYKGLFKKPSSLANLGKHCEDTHPGSAQSSVASTSSTASGGTSDQLSKFASFLRQPTKTMPSEKKKAMGFMPFSDVGASTSTTAPKPPTDVWTTSNILPEEKKWKSFLPSGGTTLPTGTKAAKNSENLRNTTNMTQGGTTLLRKTSQGKKLADEGNNITMQEAIQIFPSLQRFSSAAGRSIPNDKIQMHKAIPGFPGFERRLKELLVKAWEEEERTQRAVMLPHIRPEEVLRCRYLRLSQNNINTLLKLCKDSGMEVDIHPHMQESEIDIRTVMSPSNNTVSL